MGKNNYRNDYFGYAGYGMLSYHFILLDGSMKVLRTTQLAFENTFVDARGLKNRNCFKT